MQQDSEITDVLFRRDKDSDSVFAIMPAHVGTNDINTMTCYAHIGQHGAADIEYVQGCKNVHDINYHELKAELEGQGYRVRTIKRMHRGHYLARQRQLGRVN